MKMKPILSFLLFFSFLGSTFAQSVGTTEGVFNVSDMGAANYSIPIKVPDGVGGLQPNIAINYNSQGGNGPLGMGWSISGLSSITRTGNTIYNDSKVNAITLGDGDRFALDGNRLILTSGSTYGAANTGYNTEVESFKQITANGALAGGPLSFTVKDQNGVTYEYGGTGAYVIAQGSTAPYTWLLKKVSDLNGNFLTISYNINDGVAFPNEIAYNQNSGSSAAPKNFVKFIYAGSLDFDAFGYLAGGKISTYTVLEGIKVIYNNGQARIYRSYSFDYETDFYPHLKTVTEKGAEETESLKPTEFTYGIATQNYTADNVWSGGPNTTDYNFYSGDFNGDGKADLIQYPRNYSSGSTWALYESVGNNFNQIQTGTLNDPQNYERKNIPRNYYSSFFDFNGDGKEDFTYKSTTPNQSSSGQTGAERDNYNVLLSNGTSLIPMPLSKPGGVNGNVSGENFIDTYPLTGDFDGDGKTEILAIRKYIYTPYNTSLIGEKYLKQCTGGTGCSQNVKVATPLLDFPFIASYTTGPYAQPNPDEQPKILVIDYNGDGKSDILFVNQGTSYIYTMNVSFDANNNPVIGNPSFKLVNSTGYPTIWHKYLNVGDFNGDGQSDVITYSTNGGWEIGYGNGNGWMNDIKPVSMLNIYTQGFSTDNNVVTPLFVTDFNGDGKTDIYIYPRLNLNNSTNPVILYSKGNNSFWGETLTNANPKIAKDPVDYFFGDFSGDGQADFLTKYPGNWPYYLFTFHPDETRHLLSKVKNGLGSETKIYYKPLTNSAVYSSGTNTYTYPYIKRTIPLRVVSTVNEDNGINTSGNNINYTYAGLKFNAHGKGLMGFDNVTSFDQASLVKVSKNFLLNTTYAFPYLGSSYTINSNTLINTFSISNGVYHYGNKRIFTYPIISEQYNALTGESVQTTNGYYFYDAGQYGDQGNPGSNYSGKPFSVTVNKGYGLDITTQVFSFLYRLPSNSSGGLYSGQTFVNSKPCKVVTTNTRQGQPAYSRTDTFIYDATFGYLNQSISNPGTSNAVANGAYYDAYGNPIIKYTTATGLPAHSEFRAYDPSHRYVTESYSLAFQNIKSKATYDALTGNKLTETAPDGFQTTYTYDAFGRVKTTSNNNGLNSTNTYVWGGQPPSEPFDAGGCYYTGTVLNTGEKSYTLYDRLGREYKTSYNNFQGEWVQNIKWYNNKGQLAGMSKPYIGLTWQSITNTYDNYGRLTQVTAPEGNTIYTYSPVGNNYYTVSTTNPAGQTTKVKRDASGTNESTTDAQNNVLSYTYHSNGNVKSVTGAGTTLQTYTYDAYNHLTERWDPNYGTYKYTYDAYGQTLTQTDPKSQVYSFKYDALGRMYQKNGPEGEYVYKFDNSVGINCGKLTLLTGPEGKINYDYGMGGKISGIGYDDDGLVSQLTGNSLSNLQVKTFTYDNFGRLQQQVHWPTNTTLWYEYGSNGDITQIVNNWGNVVLYEKTGENAAGQCTSYRQSNPDNGYELTTDINYNSFNLLTTQTSYDSYGNLVRDMSYDFSLTSGNLKKRKDNKYGLGETFDYDDLNRLTGISNANNPALDIGVQFSTRGNIEQKTDAGMSFQYDAANRVSLIELDPNLPETIPEATQTLTYTPFDKVQTIDEGDYRTEFHYWPDGSRSMMATTNNNTGEQWYKTYVPGVETKYDIMSGQKVACTYVNSPEDNVVAMVTTDFSSETNHFVLTDHLGSFTQVVHEDGYIEEEKSFDAWGRSRNPQSWEPHPSSAAGGLPDWVFDRGYTGHEHLLHYGIINMNGRLYDPVMGRMFSPDPVMGSGGSLQGYNRYTYAMNNPLSYTDPSGKWVQYVVGAVLGGISGWQLGKANGATGWGMFGYIAGGAAIGAASGGLGGAVAGSGGFMANTAGIAASSFTYTGGMALLSGGKTDVSVSFGIGSYNLSKGEFGYFGKEGNNTLENIGYGFGALANIQDGFAGFNGTDIDVKSRPKLAGHSQIDGQYNGSDILISVGPQGGGVGLDPFPDLNGLKWENEFLKMQLKGTPYPGENWSYIQSWQPQINTKLNNVNGNLMLRWTNKLNNGMKLLGNKQLIYGFNNGCVNFTSRALLYSGVLNINALLPLTAPVLLNAELAIRNAGIIASPFLINR